jgi:hypothetical protein
MLTGDSSIDDIFYNTITCGNGKQENPRNEKLVILMVILGGDRHQSNRAVHVCCLQTENQPHLR